jgi:TatD DNase family protein
MYIIDTHAHIYAKEFDNDRPEVIRAAKAAGVQAILLPNEDAGSMETLHALCDREPDFAFPMMGLHPTSVRGDYIPEMRQIESALTQRKYVAIGEIGIDLYWDKQYYKEQKAVFEEQLRWSIDLQLPVAIHLRNSFDETLDSIYKTGADRLKGVFHCFGGTIEQWNEIAKLTAFFVGIGGIITYKNSGLQDTLRHIPVERIVLETDSPYLAPVPFRGKRNEPAMITETAQKVAACYGMTSETLSQQTSRNSCILFDIPIKNISDAFF